jgi:putative tryptophan/tyrosine transport system substrate-binding protein
MRRRELILAAGAAIWPVRVRAQRPATPVIGFLIGGFRDSTTLYVAAFLEGLSKIGYVEGQNIAIEYRWAEGAYDRLPALAADLVGRKVDVIAAGDLTSALAAKSATSTIPIIFLSGARPGRARAGR